MADYNAEQMAELLGPMYNDNRADAAAARFGAWLELRGWELRQPDPRKTTLNAWKYEDGITGPIPSPISYHKWRQEFIGCFGEDPEAMLCEKFRNCGSLQDLCELLQNQGNIRIFRYSWPANELFNEGLPKFGGERPEVILNGEHHNASSWDTQNALVALEMPAPKHSYEMHWQGSILYKIVPHGKSTIDFKEFYEEFKRKSVYVGF